MGAHIFNTLAWLGGSRRTENSKLACATEPVSKNLNHSTIVITLIIKYYK